MRVLVTGNMGYIGSVLVQYLGTNAPHIQIEGFDCGFFAHCITSREPIPEIRLVRQHFGDMRDFPAASLENIDAVVHLAGISNDPIGTKFEAVTEDINSRCTLKLARLAKEYGVKHFVFASSCSLYGASGEGERSERDTLNPLTAYARSKASSEHGLQEIAGHGLQITALRFSTACGMSPRLRLDLVLNDFVAAAVLKREIKIMSDGTPWRPLIDVQDIARAIEWALERDGEDFLAINVGSKERNHQVHDLAEAVARAIPGTRISINHDATPDKRSYRVDFSLFKKVAPKHQPQRTLEESIESLKKGIEKSHIIDPDFHQSRFIRLKVLETHIAEQRLSSDLRWIS